MSEGAGAATDAAEESRFRVAAAVILCSAFFLRVLLMEGVSGSDDVAYLEFAERAVTFTPFDTVSHAGGRLLFLILIGLPYRLGGHAVYAVVANIAYAAITDLIATAFAWRELGRRAGLLAALLSALNPISIACPSRILPDTLLATFAILAVTVIHRAAHDPDWLRRLRGLAMGGALVGLANMCKDPGILLLPPVVLCLFTWHADRSLRARIVPPAVVLAAFGAVWIADGLAYVALTGDFFYRATATARAHDTTIAAATSISEAVRMAAANVRLVLEKGRWLLFPVLIGLPLLAWTAVARPRYRLIAMSGLFVGLFLILGSSNLSAYRPLPFHVRYFQPIVPFAAIAAASLFAGCGWAGRRMLGVIVPAGAGGLVFFSGLHEVTNAAGVSHRAPILASIRTAVEVLDDEQKPFFVAPCLHKSLAHVLSPGFVGRVQPIPPGGPLPDGLYLHPYPETEAMKGCLSRARAHEIEQLPVRLRVAQDMRASQRLRTSPRYRRYSPALLVVEKSGRRLDSGLPDLVVAGTDCRPAAAETLRCEVVVQNRGAGFSGPSRLSCGDSGAGIPALPGWTRHTAVLEVPRTRDSRDLTVQVDATGAVAEIDEENNSARIGLSSEDPPRPDSSGPPARPHGATGGAD